MADVKKSKLKNIGTGILKKDACIALVKTEWNSAIVDQLEAGCIAELEKNDVKEITVVTVPGAVEIPFAVKQYWENSSRKQRPSAFIVLACVIRGDTHISTMYAGQ